MFSLASKLLATTATPAFEKVYEKVCSIWDAKDELLKLRRSIQTIQAVLPDAEKKQDTSAAIKDWVDRVKDALYDADDLFDEVATDEMLKQQIIKERKPLKKVRASCSKFNPIDSRNSIANQVKDIRERLLDISTDMAQFNFVICQHEKPISGAKGSEIIVTIRSESFAKAVGALKEQTHNLERLSKRESWDLFKKIACTSERDHEKDPRWANIGRDIVKKCANVPLAISSVAGLLCTKDTIDEWKLFKDNELSKVELSDDPIMQTLKLSYDHLPSNLKSCFAYCSIFPKDHIFDMNDLIYLWIAQGYIKPEKQTVEQIGYSYFMDLHRRYFFQKGDRWDGLFRKGYKMHDLIHDLAQCVAGEEIIVLTKSSYRLNKRARHVTVGDDGDTSRMLNINQLRSLFFLPQWNKDGDRQFTYGKCLRALSLSGLGIHTVSSCIGELKQLRYLNLSNNEFESLPDSLMNLLNLLTLDISGCRNLKALPYSFKKLINLRHLNIEMCCELKHMPPGMGELTCLQNLSCFMVGKAIEGVQMSGLDVLAEIQLRGVLTIQFEEGMDNWDGDECWNLPKYLDVLIIERYPGRKIPHWSNHISRLDLDLCYKVKYLPPLRCLPNLKYLRLFDLRELEYIEEEGEEDNRCTIVAAGSINNNASFFPLLEELKLEFLPRLKGWSRRKVESTTASSAGSASPHLFLSFPLLSELLIIYCEELSSLPLCPCLRKLHVAEVDGGLIQQLLSTASTRTSPSSPEELSIDNPSSWLLDDLRIRRCAQLKNLHIARLYALRELRMLWRPEELELLWGIQKEKRCVDWDSLPNLRLLVVDPLPSNGELPDCLRRQHARGELEIRGPTANERWGLDD